MGPDRRTAGKGTEPGGLGPLDADGTGLGLASGREAQAGALRRRAFDTYNEHRAR